MPRPACLPRFCFGAAKPCRRGQITGGGRLVAAAAAIALAASFLPALPAAAQGFTKPDVEFTRGRTEYLASCAGCHGEDADGAGPLATYLNIPVPGLRDLAARNDGAFPLLQVIQIIDGRAVIRGHGNPMPVFGNRYSVQIEDLGTLYGTEVLVRARVLELATYLHSIQN